MPALYSELKTPTERALLLTLSPDEVRRPLWPALMAAEGAWPVEHPLWPAFERWGAGDEAHVRWETELRDLEALGAEILTPLCASWPPGLPHWGVLRVRGALPGGPAVAVVGARKADASGLDITRRVAERAVSAGWTVISGGAPGVDLAAHLATAHAGGRTVVVLGGGLSQRLGQRRAACFEAVLEAGAVVSSFPCAMPPHKGTFPRRNRWIARWAERLVVVQADLRSGSLITARSALASGRPVWATPGPIDSPLHRGCHALYAEGAACLTTVGAWCPEGVDRGSGVNDHAAPAPEDVGAEACKLWSASGATPEPLHLLAHRAGLKPGPTAVAATMLELSGWLVAHPGGLYTRRRPR